MKPQLFVPMGGKIKRIPQGRLAISNSPGFHKPEGAFWTSTLRGQDSSAWLDWVDSEMPHWRGEEGVIFQVSSKARILTVRARRPESVEIEPLRPFLRRGRYGVEIDWEAVAREYDGVHVTSRPYNDLMSFWDVESTAWFDMRVLKPIRRIKL